MVINKIGERTAEVTNPATGNVTLYTICTTKNGVAIQDSDVDNDVYIKLDYQFFKKNYVSLIVDYSFTNEFDI